MAFGSKIKIKISTEYFFCDFKKTICELYKSANYINSNLFCMLYLFVIYKLGINFLKI